MNICNFPDEILYKISENLSLQNKINFFNSSNHLKDISSYYSLGKSNLYLTDMYSICNSAFFFNHVTVNIVTEVVYKRFEEYVNQYDQYHGHILRLDISSLKIKNIDIISFFRNLNFLNLHDTFLQDLRPLQHLYRLKKLVCYNTKIKNIIPLQYLTSLRSLDISHNDIDNITPLMNLTNMKKLRMFHTKVSNIDPLTLMTKLHYLNISDTPVENIDVLRNLNSLKVLILTNTNSYDISSLICLTNLTYLDLSNTKIVSGDPLFYLVNLTTLRLNLTNIKNLVFLNPESKLQYLNLTSCVYLTDIEPIIRLKNIVSLDIRGTRINNISVLKKIIGIKHIYISVLCDTNGFHPGVKIYLH